MTVGQLINRLSQLDPDLPVVVPGVGDEYRALRAVERAFLWTEDNEFFERSKADPRQQQTPVITLKE